MTKHKQTKRALISSMLSLVLCFTMLLGTTFAWFTDTASTAVNKIQAGTLDVALEMKDADGTWVTAEGKTLKFVAADGNENILWEPGATFDLQDIRIKNNGNLTLKYEVVVTGIQGDAKLNEAIEWTVDYTNSDARTLNHNELKAGETAELYIEGHMIEEAGNEYQGLSIEGAAITVLATQAADEYDSYENTYDTNATYPTPVTNQESLNAALTSTQSEVTVSLPSNTTVTLDNNIVNNANKNVTIMGNGTQTVDIITNSTSAENGKLNYQRTSNFTFENVTIKAGEGDFDGIVCDEIVFNNCIITGKVTLYGKATFINCTFENTMADQYSIWTWGGTNVLVKDCVFNTNGKAILLYGYGPTNLVVDGCTFIDRNNGSVEKAVVEIGNDYNATYSLTATNNTISGFAINANGTNTGTKMYGNKNSMDAAHLTVNVSGTVEADYNPTNAANTVYISTREELVAFANDVNENRNSYAGKIVALTADIDMAGIDWTPVANESYYFNGTFDGQNHTISNLTINDTTIAPGHTTAFIGRLGANSTINAAIKNVTFDNASVTGYHDVAVAVGYNEFGSVDNVKVINSSVTAKCVSTSENDEPCGDKAGAVVGFVGSNSRASVTNCHAENCTVTAGRDAGQVIGMAYAINTLTNNTASNVTVAATGECTGANITNGIIGRQQ